MSRSETSSPVERIPSAASLTHQHLLAVVHTLAGERIADGRWRAKDELRVLDAGCGDGVMLAYFASALPSLLPGVRWTFFGYDVSDSEVQRPGYFDDTISRLTAAVPDVDWPSRLHLIRSDEPWPFGAEGFDIIVSNQVGEHVEHFDLWLREQRRTLAEHGVAVHLFPLVHYPWESHLGLPFVHRVASHDLATAYIHFWLRRGLSFRQSGGPVAWSAESHADFLRYQTWYRTGRDVLLSAKRAGLRASYRFCGEMLTTKLRRLMGREARLTYRVRRPRLRDALRDWAAYTLAKYAPIPRSPGVTLVCENENVYRKLPQPSAPGSSSTIDRAIGALQIGRH